jgi:hypothetical protein
MTPGCLPDPYSVGEPDSLFSEFVLVWDLVEEYYASFTANPDIDWDLVYSSYRDAGMNIPSYNGLASLSLEMLGELQDMSICMRDSVGNRLTSYDKGYFHNWDHDVWVSYMIEWGGSGALQTYGSFPLQQYGDSIGYLYIGSLGDSYDILAFFGATNPISSCSKLILDLRTCSPTGFDYNAAYSMGRFTATLELAYYRSYRTGPGRLDMGPLQPVITTRNGAWQFTDPIIVLTGRQTQGAAELLVILLKTQDHVTVIGDTTAGYANPVDSYNLTRGWTIEIPYMTAYTPDSVCIFNRGTPPDLEIPVSQSDFDAGIDPVLDAALDMALE